MEKDKGFFIENILKDTKFDKSEKISEEDGTKDPGRVNEKRNSGDQEENDWLNPGSSCKTPRIFGILPTVYPVISNRLDTREGKRE